MPSIPRVFVSATSRDLGSYRKVVADTLRGVDAHDVIQDDFTPDYRSVVKMLEEKIVACDAVICLVGGLYGSEPARRTADEPRRSYTQLEYEIADRLNKPVFLFVATEECPLDHPDDKPGDDETRGLQLEHIKRIKASNRVRMAFRSRDDLAFQVRGMRFDADGLAQGVTTRLAVILDAELLDAGGARGRLGEAEWVNEVVKPYQGLLRETLGRRGGTVGAESPTECVVNFETADAAVDAALDLHEAIRRLDWPAGAPGLRVGIHVGQVVQFVGSDESRVLQASHATAACRRLTGLALPGQTLLSRTAFDIAREHVRRAPTSPSAEAGVSALRWCAHGRYRPTGPGDEEALEVYEVGEEGRAPLVPPPDTPQMRRADSQEEREMEGWRPAVGQEIPRQAGWVIERKLGEGGFGEVWVALSARMRERRVFKFCFDAGRLGSFKRELSLFKLLRDALGDRPDIARLLEVRLDQAPYYLESEFVPSGNLRDWALEGSRLSTLPLDERLRLLAETARATAAAHSVGVIHKDLKPSNIFMRKDAEGRWHPILADFGIGAVADKSELERRGITVAGWTQSLLEPGSSRTGTRMYQPPESSAGRPAMMQADVYALGVLLYQLLLGDFDTPFGEGWEDELASAWRRLDLDPLADRRFRLLTGDIRACVLKDPSLRLGTAAQVVERLETLSARVAADEAEDARRRAESEAAEAVERASLARASARRLRRALAGAFVVLAVIAGLGLFAYAQKRDADAARGDANENEKKAKDSAAEAIHQKKAADVARGVALENEAKAEANARQAKANADAAREQSRLALATLSAMIFDIQRSVKNLPAGSEARRRLLTTALARLEGLSGEFVEKSSVDRNTAASLMEMGHLVLQFGDAPQPGAKGTSGGLDPKATAGAIESARGLYTRANAIFESLAKADPADAEARLDLAVSCTELGDLNLRLGAVEPAQAMYQKGLDLREAAARADPADARARRGLAISCSNLGDVHLQLGAVERAQAMYHRALELREAAARADPADARARRDLAISYNRLGDVHLQLGAAERAQAMYQRALELDEAAAKADPADAEARRDLAISYNRLGGVHLRLGAVERAQAMYQRALELDEAAAKADPADAQARRGLAISYSKLGDVHLRLGAVERAQAMYQKALDLAEAAAKADSADAQARRGLAISCSKLGDLHLRLGAVERAQAMYQKALDLAEAAAKADPADAEARRDLAISYNRLGGVHLQLGAAERAQAMYQKALDLAEAAAKADPADAQARRGLAASYTHLGDVHLRLGAVERAQAMYQRALELDEAAAKDDPADAEARRDLSVSHRNLGDAFEQARNFRESRMSYERALRLDQEILKQLPQEPETRRDLAVDCEFLGQVCVTTGDWSAAIDYACQAVAHAREAHRIEGDAVPDGWDYSVSLRSLALGQVGTGRLRDAKQSFEQAIEANLKWSVTHNGLALLLATAWDDTVRDGKRAVELATKACELEVWKNPLVFETLAAAYAEAGKFEDAVKWQKKALETPAAFGKDLEQVKARLALYEAGKAFHESKPAPAAKPNEGRP